MSQHSILPDLQGEIAGHLCMQMPSWFLTLDFVASYDCHSHDDQQLSCSLEKLVAVVSEQVAAAALGALWCVCTRLTTLGICMPCVTG